MTVTRRQFLATFLATTAAAAIGAYRFLKFQKPEIPGRICGANFSSGHLLREFSGKNPDRTITCGTVIVGGGISGLAAAWKLAKSGYEDLLLLELEDRPGGNAQSGVNEISPFPWGAHYVPVPSPEANLVREFFNEIGVITGTDSVGRPKYNELYVCHAPQERLYHFGRWQEGLLPHIGISEEDRRQYKEFFHLIDTLKYQTGKDGRRPFAVPLALSSADQKFRDWDRITMRDFMSQRGFTSEPLLWHVNYCCRDDYGATIDQVSAWAGLHYFASRLVDASDLSEETLLTWPAGNGWLVNEYEKKVGRFIQCGKLVLNIAQAADHALVDYLDLQKKEVVRITCRAVIYAAPRFTAPYVLAELRGQKPAYLESFSYAPWMVANLSLKQAPRGYGADLAWDNVFYGSDSLGYVVATHQNISTHQKKTVLTYYLPLSGNDPIAERKQALASSYETWRDRILSDLERVHPGITSWIERIDVWIWGHGMIRPTPGFIWGEQRQQAQKPLGRIHFAHSDMSGISIFEEAQFHGVRAAEAVMAQVGHAYESSLAGAA